jgi:alpha-L-fucosidase
MNRFSHAIAGGDCRRAGLATASPPGTAAARAVAGWRAGAASRQLKARLQAAGAPPDAVRRAVIAACEAEMNVVMHSRGGRMDARLAPGRVDVEVSDARTGVGRRARRSSPLRKQRVIREYPAASASGSVVPRRSRGGLDAAARALGLGAGMGLANIRRASDAFAIDSVPGRGTRVRSTVYLFLKGADTAAAGTPLRIADCELRIDSRTDRTPLSFNPQSAIRNSQWRHMSASASAAAATLPKPAAASTPRRMMLLRLMVVGTGVAALLLATGCMAAGLATASPWRAGPGEPAATPSSPRREPRVTSEYPAAPAAGSTVPAAARADGAKTLLVPARLGGGPFKPDWESLKAYEVPEWFRDAKFGIWAHWSAQCVPEQGAWYARRMYEEGSNDYKFHVAHYGHPSKVGFKDICTRWKAEKWEPEKLIDLYRKAGAKYFVALANHHCNFDCWDSRYHEWNSVKVGPKKNIVGTWADAARRAGLRFGVTVHAARAWSWYEVAQGADKQGPLAGVPYDGKLTKADGKGLWWDGLDPQVLYAQNHKPGEKPDQAYVDQFYARVTDLVDHYKPDLLYFDDSLLPLNNISDAGLRIAAHLYNSSIQWHGGKNEAVMNTKAVPAELRKALVWDIERGRSDRLEPFPWQTDTCIGNWHYNASLFENHRYKTAATVITTLIDIVSKNGNLLLNVPVKGDGTIDADEVKVLEDLARWMEVNGVAIFGTRPWIIFGEGGQKRCQEPYDFKVPDTFSDPNFGEGRGRGYTAEDIRFTTKGDTIYAFILGWPQKPVVIRSMAAKSPLVEGEVGNVALLGHDGKLQWSRTDEGLVIKVPDQKPCEHAFAFRITGLKTHASADTR